MKQKNGHLFSTAIHALKKEAAAVDIVLLVFLLLFLNIGMAFKLMAIVLIYALRRNFKFGSRLKGQGRLPLFYLAMALFCIVQIPFHAGPGKNYLVLSALVTGYWLLSFLVIHQVQVAIEKNGIEKVEKALLYFFIINTGVSFFHIIRIMLETGTINPYTYEGMDLKYHTSTGDYIRGVMFDSSTANMVINAFGLFFFLYRQKYVLSLFCLVVVLLTTSNLGNVILFCFVFYVLLFDKNLLHKSLMVLFIGIAVVFLVKVSPTNASYFINISERLLNKPHAITTIQAQSQKPRQELLMEAYVSSKEKEHAEQPTEKELASARIIQQINATPSAKAREDTNFVQDKKTFQARMNVLSKNFYNSQYDSSEYRRFPGKIISFKETGRYLSGSAGHFLAGAGPGNFSSKLAFKACGVGIYGAYPQKLAYVSEPFKNNHLKLFFYYYTQPYSEHSVINTPNSALNQLLGEYGIIGLALFLLLYVWFFLKHFRQLSYGKILLPMCLGFLMMDYWFEQFSIMVIFEAMMLLDVYRAKQEEVHS